MLVVGAAQFVRGGAHVQPPAPPVAGVEALSIFLLLRAFAAGCTALTGVEAIADGVPAFQPPEWRNARTTLTVRVAVAISMFMGITLLVHALGLVPQPSGTPTLLSLLARATVGDGPLFAYIQITTALILALAANTAFADFPRLSYFMARDGFMPRRFVYRGDRLSFSNGIITIALLAAILIVAFRGNVGALVQLYVVGVFCAFTLSQAGMVKRWWTRRAPGWRRGLALNGAGMTCTGIVLAVTVVARFLHGAWLVVVLIALLMVVFWRIHGHYQRAARQLVPHDPPTPAGLRNTIVVPVADLNQAALRALAYARTLGTHVLAVHVSDSAQDTARLKEKWEAWGNHVPLVVIDSPYRSIVSPLLAYLDALATQHEGDTLTIVLPEFVTARVWENLLHNGTAPRLRAELRRRPNTAIISYPFHLHQ
jgi:hypothetical protein